MPTLRAGARSERGLPPTGSGGFTLIELTMVILVIGIVGALVLPRFGGLLDRQQMRRSVNVVRGMVRQLHAKAALTKRVYRLTFDLDEQQLTVCFLESLPARRIGGRHVRAGALPRDARLRHAGRGATP